MQVPAISEDGPMTKSRSDFHDAAYRKTKLDRLWIFGEHAFAIFVVFAVCLVVISAAISFIGLAAYMLRLGFG